MILTQIYWTWTRSPIRSRSVNKHLSGRGKSDIERSGTFSSKTCDVLGNRFHRDGKGSQVAERTLCKGTASWWRDRFFLTDQSVSMRTECRRVHSHVYSTAPKRLRQLAETGHHADQGTRMGNENSTSHISSQDVLREKAGLATSKKLLFPFVSK